MNSYFEMLRYRDTEAYFEIETEYGLLEFYEHTDYIEVFLDSIKLGSIFHNPGDWELIRSGINPIESDWEDGGGESLSYDGWGTVSIYDIVGCCWGELNNHQRECFLDGYMVEESKTQYKNGVITVTVLGFDHQINQKKYGEYERVFQISGRKKGKKYIVDDEEIIEEV